ncbi:MAG: pilin [bacterium]|nr:pilin [bacterium]
MRNILLILLFIALITPNVVFAASAFEFDPGNRLATTLDVPTQNPRIIYINVLRWSLGLLGLVGVSVVLIGGFTWMTAAGNEEKIGKAKKILTYAIIGLIIIVSAFVLVSTVIDTAADVSGL